MDHELISDNIIKLNQKEFNVEHIITSEKNNNHTLYAYISPLLLNFFNGINICLVLTGQTGTGKSHSLFGTRTTAGILQQLAKEIFLQKISMQSNNIESRIFIQCIEFLTEATDILGQLFTNRAKHIMKKSLKVNSNFQHRLTTHQDEIDFDPHSNNYTYIEIKSYEDMLSILKEANKLRTISATKQNKSSSRRHLLIRIDLLKNKTLTTIDLFDIAGTEQYAYGEASASHTININLHNSELLHLVTHKIDQKPNRLKNSTFVNMLKKHFIKGATSKALIIVHINLDKSNVRNTNHFITSVADLIKYKKEISKQIRRNSLI